MDAVMQELLQIRQGVITLLREHVQALHQRNAELHDMLMVATQARGIAS